MISEGVAHVRTKDKLSLLLPVGLVSCEVGLEVPLEISGRWKSGELGSGRRSGRMRRLTDSVGIRWLSQAQVGLRCGRSPGMLERRICLERRDWEGNTSPGNGAVPWAEEKRVQ